MNPRVWLSQWLACLLLVLCLALPAPFAYSTNTGSNNVSVIDTATNSVVTTVAMGTLPLSVAVNSTETHDYAANSSNRHLRA